MFVQSAAVCSGSSSDGFYGRHGMVGYLTGKYPHAVFESVDVRARALYPKEGYRL